MTRLQADLLLLVVAIVWGLAFVFQKTAMDHLGPMTFIAARSLVGALALAPLAFYETRKRETALTPDFWRLTAWTSVALFGGEALQQIGMVTASVTNSGFLTALYVICVPFIAWVVLRIRPPTIVWPAAALSFAGTWLLGGGDITALSAGDRLVAASAVVWAIHVVLTSQAAHFDRPLLFTCIQFAIVTLVGGAIAFVTETITLSALKAAWVEIAYVGLLSSAFTFTILIVAMRHASPSEAAIIISTESLFGALGGALFMGERLGFISWTGAALIVIATLLVHLAPHWRVRQQLRAPAALSHASDQH
jgi:drug/metabolite transporter (DMT)-like permease